MQRLAELQALLRIAQAKVQEAPEDGEARRTYVRLSAELAYMAALRRHEEERR